MSSILKLSSVFTRVIVGQSLSRCRPNTPKWDGFRYFNDVSVELRPQTTVSLIRYIEELDKSTRKRDMINGKLLRKIVSFAESRGSLNGLEARALLRATGSYAKDLHPTERNDLTERVWALIDKAEMDISHFNTLLQVKRENNLSSDPPSLLQSIEQHKLTPNQVTYKQIIDILCDSGLVEQANQMLEKLDPGNSQLYGEAYRSIIRGCLRAKDEKSALKTIEIMKSHELPINSETYLTLACGLIENGKYSEAKTVSEKMDLSDDHVLEIFRAGVLAGTDLKICTQVLNWLPRLNSYRQFLVNTELELITLGKLDAALLLTRIMAKETPDYDGSYVFKHIGFCNYPIDTIVKASRELANEIPGAILGAASIRISKDEIPAALEFIKVIRDEGFPIRPHYFLPMICKTQSDEEILNLLATMISYKAPATIQIFHDFIVPRMNVQNPEATIARLVEDGYNRTLSFSVVISNLLHRGNVKKCFEFLKPCSTQIDSARIVDHLARATDGSNLRLSVDILELLAKYQINSQRQVDVVAKYLLLLDTNLFGVAAAMIAEKKLPIELNAFSKLKTMNVDVSSLEALTFVRDIEPSKSFVDMDVDELQSHLIELESKHMNTRGVLRKLCLLHCRNDDLDKALEAYNKLGRTSSSGAVEASFMEMYVRKNDAEKALSHYQKLTQFKDFFLDSYKLVDLATMLVQQKRLGEAKELLKKHNNSRITAAIHRNVNELVRSVTINYGPDVALDMVKTIVPNYCEVSSKSVSNLIFEVLKTDLKKAADLYVEIGKRFRKTVVKNTVLKQLIIANEEEAIERVVAATFNMQNLNLVKYDLSICYLECGKLDKAEELLRGLNMSRMLSRFSATCNNYLDSKQWEHLETFLNLCEELNVDASYISVFRNKLKSAKEE